MAIPDLIERALRDVRNQLKSAREELESAREELRVECKLRVEVERELHNTLAHKGGLEDSLEEAEEERNELARQLAESKERNELVKALLPVQLDQERRISALERWQWRCDPDEYAYQQSEYGKGQEPDRVIEGLDTETPEVQRDEARAVARELLSRCMSMASSGPSRVGEIGGCVSKVKWIEEYPWLADEKQEG